MRSGRVRDEPDMYAVDGSDPTVSGFVSAVYGVLLATRSNVRLYYI